MSGSSQAQRGLKRSHPSADSTLGMGTENSLVKSARVSSLDDDDTKGSKKIKEPVLVKTMAMVDDPETDYCISWAEDGKSFVVKDEHVFATEVLPNHFRTKNFASFVRQLNFYGFKKRTDNRGDVAQSHFSHPFFRRGEPGLVAQIKRKPTGEQNVNVKDAITSLNEEVKDLKERYDNIWNIQKQILYVLSQFVRPSEGNQLGAGSSGNRRFISPQPSRQRKNPQLYITAGDGHGMNGHAMQDVDADDTNNPVTSGSDNVIQNLHALQDMVSQMSNAPPASMNDLMRQLPSRTRSRVTNADNLSNRIEVISENDAQLPEPAFAEDVLGADVETSGAGVRSPTVAGLTTAFPLNQSSIPPESAASPRILTAQPARRTSSRGTPSLLPAVATPAGVAPDTSGALMPLRSTSWGPFPDGIGAMSPVFSNLTPGLADDLPPLQDWE